MVGQEQGFGQMQGSGQLGGGHHGLRCLGNQMDDSQHFLSQAGHETLRILGHTERQRSERGHAVAAGGHGRLQLRHQIGIAGRGEEELLLAGVVAEEPPHQLQLQMLVMGFELLDQPPL